ncbi:hypothetical protein FS749_004691, partial [Ceratobasidium sp. UAMH 11750]
MSSAHSKVFETPELLSLVCKYSELGTCVTLLRVNGSSFRAAVPFVWNNVNHVSHLLKLIPGTTGMNIIGLPPLANTDFTRFDFYARHVRSLVVDCSVQVIPWQTLVLQSKQRPLLPRLSYLNIERQDQTAIAIQGVMWTTIFLGPNLTEAHIAKIGPVSMLGISVLLNSISESCAHVEGLFLPPVRERTEGMNGEHCLLSLLPNRPIPESFLALSNIRVLTAGLWIFRPESLQALGSLSQLQLLRVLPDGFSTAPLEPVPLHENSFPALKQLLLLNLFWSHIGMVLRHRPLIENLVSLELIAVNDEDSDSWDDIDAALITLEGAPGLTELVIDFAEPNGYEINPGEILVDILSRLPLRTVRFINAHFAELGLFRLSETFPALEELRLPNQFVDLDDFSIFATIPNLKHLIVKPDNFAITDLVARQGERVCPSLHTLEFTDFWTVSFTTENARIVAKYFYRVFPNMKQTIWPKENQTVVPYYDMTLLDAYLGMLRERSATRVRIAGQYGWDIA